jgi:hypothetical protein
MNTTATFLALIGIFLMSTTSNSASISQAETDKSDVFSDEQMLEWLLINYKMHTRVMCGRLLEHYEGDALRALAVGDNWPDRLVRPDLKSKWIQDLAVALGHSLPNVTRVDHDANGNAAITVAWAGGRYYYGVTVGTKEFTLKDTLLFSIRCAPGIYVWNGVPHPEEQKGKG